MIMGERVRGMGDPLSVSQGIVLQSWLIAVEIAESPHQAIILGRRKACDFFFGFDSMTLEKKTTKSAKNGIN